MKKFILLLIAVLFLFPLVSWGQTTVFSDDFSTNNNATYTTSGAIGSSSWSVTRAGADWGARINTSPAQLEQTNDVGTTANVNGWVFSSTATSSFSSPYNTTLNLNSGLVTWFFNMRQIRTDPAGFSSGSYGVAYILGGTSTTAATAGNGYAVVLGGTGTTDPIRLVKYTGGIQTLTGGQTGIIVSITSGLTDFGAEYLSVKVTYNPSNDQWELFLRNDGTSAFAEPTTGTLTSQGTASDNTYTSAALSYMGAYWQGSTTANQTSFFDNVSVNVTISPTTNVTLIGTGSGTGQISWTAPTVYNNSNNETIVFLKDGSAITEGTPSNDISGYTANASFGNGTSYQNDVSAYCVYKGDGTSVNVTNITDGHTYYALVFNTNGSSVYSSSATNNAVLPVELISFSAYTNNKTVNLSWRTATEVNNYGFEILRSAQNDKWEKIGFVNGHGNSNSPKNYSFTDEPYGGKVFKYRLKQIDFDGAFEYSDEVTAVFEDVTTFELEQNYPNPFNPSTKISYTIPQRSNVKLRVYNMLAQLEAELVNDSQEAGHYQVIFNGSNLPSGTYFYKLEAGKFVQVKKFLLVK